MAGVSVGQLKSGSCRGYSRSVRTGSRIVLFVGGKAVMKDGMLLANDVISRF
jgi:hypothetical protein